PPGPVDLDFGPRPYDEFDPGLDLVDIDDLEVVDAEVIEEPTVDVVDDDIDVFPEMAALPPVASETEATAVEGLPQAPQWSRAKLKALGVPSRVMTKLQKQTLEGDAAWTAALMQAIEAVVPAPAALGDDCRTVVSGYGEAAAVDVIRAGLAGFTP